MTFYFSDGMNAIVEVQSCMTDDLRNRIKLEMKEHFTIHMYIKLETMYVILQILSLFR